MWFGDSAILHVLINNTEGKAEDGNEQKEAKILVNYMCTVLCMEFRIF